MRRSATAARVAQAAKLGRHFYQRPAEECVQEFLGKRLVYEGDRGRVAGIIIDVEAYPAFVDDVHHGNKRTPRTEVMYGPGGFAYVYLIYGTWHQLAAVVNKQDVPDVVFIRGVVPTEGIAIMQENLGRVPDDPLELANSPGKLCKSFGITRELYRTDLTGDALWLEDAGARIDPAEIRQAKRVGINARYRGAQAELRLWVPPEVIVP